jgi:hypothetical protein
VSTPEEEPFASFAEPRERPTAVEAWRRRHAEETRQWRRLVGVGVWLVLGTFGGSALAALSTGSLLGGATLLGGAAIGMPLGLAVGWLAGFASWGGRALRGTRLVPVSDSPVPMLWLGVCSGVGLVAGAAIGSVALPQFLLDPDQANLADVLGPVGVCAGAGVALLVVWLRSRGPHSA